MFKKILAAIILLAAFCVLLSLGFWQKERLAWKEDILARIAANEDRDPASDRLDLTGNGDLQYRRGRLDGAFLTGETGLLIGPRTHDGASGYHVLSPFRTSAGRIVMVNRGWIPADMKNDPLPPPQGASWVGGYLSYAKRPPMAPRNRPEIHLWYWPDPAAMAAYYDIDAVMPAILYMEARQNPAADYPVAFDGLPQPRNKHAQYMIFWFGMAGLLVLLSGALIFRARRTDA